MAVGDPIQILKTGQTVGDVFVRDGEFHVGFIGIPTTATGLTWHLQALPKSLPDSSTEWYDVTSQPFSDTPGRQSINFNAASGFKYRVANTAPSPMNNTGTTAYVGDVLIKEFR